MVIRDPEGSSWGVVQWHLPGGSPWSSKLRAGHKPQVLVVTLLTAGARSKQDGRNEKSMIKLIYTYVQCDPKFMSRTTTFFLLLRGKLEGRKLDDWTSILHHPVCYVIHNLLNILYQGCQLFKSSLLQM